MWRAAEGSVTDLERQRYEQARKHVEALRGFYVHAIVFVVVNIGLFTINTLAGGAWWFFWPLMGWGIGLGAHALTVFGFGGGGPLGRDWEEHKTKEILGKEIG